VAHCLKRRDRADASAHAGWRRWRSCRPRSSRRAARRA
jgi:hypothetical protein